jgi:phage terminase small subunit
MDSLPPKQRKFVLEYLKCLNASQAARIVGYKQPGVQGNRLLQKDKIKKIIKRHAAKAEKKGIATIEDRKRRLQEIMESAEKDSDSCKAIDILNKMDAAYIERKEVSLQLKLSPEEAEERVINVYRSNPEIWKRIKNAVDGEAEADTEEEL